MATQKKPTAVKKPTAKKPAAKKVPSGLEQVEPSVIITNIYSTNVIEGINQCDKMLESFEKHGYEVANISAGRKIMGNGAIIRELYQCYKRAATGHTHFCYADGGDTYCQRPFKVPADKLVYSAESNCYPLPELAKVSPYKGDSPYKYLNGGNYAGPLSLAIEFFEKYLLPIVGKVDANGQAEQMKAYLQAEKDGFPIVLDHDCEIFQTTAFSSEADYDLSGKLIKNKHTGTTPAILHANGRSPMKWIFDHK